MAEWSFLVPPDISVTLRAAKRPPLLALALGEETEPVARPTLLLDLTGAFDKNEPSQAGRYKSTVWRMQSTTEGAPLKIVFRSWLLRQYLALHIALLPALQRLLLDRDVALLIGAACSTANGAVVFAGQTGSGKTTALLSAASRGAHLIGDEYVGLSAAGAVTPVLRVLALRNRTLATEPKLAGHLSVQRRAALKAASLSARLSLGRLDPLVHVSPSELGLSASGGPSAPLSGFIWLDPGGPSEPEPMPVEHAIDLLVGVLDTHERAYGIPWRADRARWRETISSGFSGVRCLQARAPVSSETLGAVVSQSREEARRS